MMGKLGLCGTIGLAALGALGCGDDGKVLGERSHSGGSDGSGNRSGSSSTGGSVAQGGSSPTGGANTGGTTAAGGSTGSTGGGDASGGDAGASGGVAGASGSGEGGSSNGGSAGSGAGATGGSSGTPCVDRTCGDSEACVAYRTIGGTATFPDDAGACPLNAHSENTYCLADFAYQCVAQPRCTAGTVDCTCGSCPQPYNTCRALYAAEWLDTDAKLVCELLAP